MRLARGASPIEKIRISIDLPRTEIEQLIANSYLITARELQVIRLIQKSLPNKEIAYALDVTTHTVKFHITNILRKFKAKTRFELIYLWDKIIKEQSDAENR